MNIQEAIRAIRPLDAAAMVQCKDRWNHIAKPVHGFGKFEEAFMQIAGIQRTEKIHIEKSAVIAAFGDGGPEACQTQEKSENRKMAEGFQRGNTYGAILADTVGADLISLDISGVSSVSEALEAGLYTAEQCKDKGIQILAAGDIGTALVCSEKEYDKETILEELERDGRYDILALAGVYIGGAAWGIPVVCDGYSALLGVAAAKKFSGLTASYVIPAQAGKEAPVRKLMERLALEPFLDCSMGVGQGAGASMCLGLLQMAKQVYDNADTFYDVGIKPYKVTGCH
ncbi:MAG: nicotinate-nucleotide--dimethylbenzimidazole phosphoribosyltransferase [Eubacteriales bacterium]|nr:nicotinate-nucleotide--dimethylbenzimidazole phosphoribosyltransferase [Eubacteriales bacterium]